MRFLEAVSRWATDFQPELDVVPQGRRVVAKQQFVTGASVYQVAETYLIRRKMPRNWDSLHRMQELENRLNMGAIAPIDGCAFRAEKAQLAQVLPGEMGLYQVTLQAEYTADWEDEYGKN